MEMPHTITIYNEYNGKYLKTVLHNVYWYGTDSINISGKSIVESGAMKTPLQFKEKIELFWVKDQILILQMIYQIILKL